MKDFSPIFNAIGFTDSETKTYLAALELGPSTVIDITKKTELSRQATYTGIKSLMERGVMSSVERGKKTYFVAEDPKKLLAYAKHYEQNVQNSLRELEGAVADLQLITGGEKPVVRVFEGKDAALLILSDLAESKPKEVWEIADLEAVANLFPAKEHKPFIEKFKKADIIFKAIYAGTPEGKTLEKATRYFLPKNKSGFKGDILLYKNKIALVSLSGKIHSVVIENEALAKALEILFSLALKGAEKEGLLRD